MNYNIKKGYLMTLKEYIKINNFSQYRFAKMTNISPANISRWINDKCIPSLHHLKKIKEITDGQVTIVDFYEGKQ